VVRSNKTTSSASHILQKFSSCDSKDLTLGINEYTMDDHAFFWYTNNYIKKEKGFLDELIIHY